MNAPWPRQNWPRQTGVTVDSATRQTAAGIEIEGVGKTYAARGDSAAVVALRDINLVVPDGAIVGVIGRSGAGKSSLIRLINGLERPTSGRVVVNGTDITALDERGLRAARRSIGMIFQHFNLLSSRTAFDNIALPLEIAGVARRDIAKAVLPLLDMVGLADKRDRYPAELSGGQKQRVGIARALATSPKVLLSDEATSALDPETTRAILDLLKQINRELGLTIVMITHQMEVIKQVCDRVAVLEAGQVVESGRVIDVFLRPQHEVTRAMIGDVIAQELPVSVLKRVESRLGNGRDHVYRLAFTGENVDQPVLAQAIRQHGLDFNILHGHIDEIQGQAFGSLAIMATGELADVRAAMDYLQSQGVVVEEIEHVV